jgi:hypothetical protein
MSYVLTCVLSLCVRVFFRYTEVYQAYVGVVEAQLEGFCAKHNVR